MQMAGGDQSGRCPLQEAVLCKQIHHNTARNGGACYHMLSLSALFAAYVLLFPLLLGCGSIGLFQGLVLCQHIPELALHAFPHQAG